MEKKKKRRGFTLIELIVVLAILAIIAAIAIPVAFGSLEKARDKAARSSISNIAGIAKTGAALAQLDKDLLDSMLTLTEDKSVNILGKQGEFKNKGTVVAMSTYLEKYFNDSAIQMDAKAAVSIIIRFNGKAGLAAVIVFYYPNGESDKSLYYYIDEQGEIGRFPELI